MGFSTLPQTPCLKQETGVSQDWEAFPCSAFQMLHHSLGQADLGGVPTCYSQQPNLSRQEGDTSGTIFKEMLIQQTEWALRSISDNEDRVIGSNSHHQVESSSLHKETTQDVIDLHHIIHLQQYNISSLHIHTTTLKYLNWFLIAKGKLHCIVHSDIAPTL